LEAKQHAADKPEKPEPRTTTFFKIKRVLFNSR